MILTHSKWLLSPWVIGKDCCLTVIWVERTFWLPWLLWPLQGPHLPHSPHFQQVSCPLPPNENPGALASALLPISLSYTPSSLCSFLSSLGERGTLSTSAHPTCLPQPPCSTAAPFLASPRFSWPLRCLWKWYCPKTPLYSHPIFLLPLPPSSLCVCGGGSHLSISYSAVILKVIFLPVNLFFNTF